MSHDLAGEALPATEEKFDFAKVRSIFIQKDSVNDDNNNPAVNLQLVPLNRKDHQIEFSKQSSFRGKKL